ncbi:MAG: hypothetical protein PF568_00850 [Deltaproteobacteria bacterium]|jgi:hypothetical protein|nr:hypothetical protein [Deltaproteobacteria bacterium]
MTAPSWHYALLDEPGEDIRAIVQEIPGRWGRMPPLSRAVVVEAGRLLQKERRFNKAGTRVGLIGATRYGSLAVDKAFAATMQSQPQLASPALFGYTLANIPLAVAANHYCLVVNVFALYAEDEPLQRAVTEARRWLQNREVDFMLACEFDDLSRNGALALTVNFTIVNPL